MTEPWGAVHTSLPRPCKSQMRTSPPRHPDARISLDDWWNARHQGVRGWPLKMWVHFRVDKSVIRTVWSPWEDAILDPSGLKSMRKVALQWPDNSQGSFACGVVALNSNKLSTDLWYDWTSLEPTCLRNTKSVMFFIFILLPRQLVGLFD